MRVRAKEGGYLVLGLVLPRGGSGEALRALLPFLALNTPGLAARARAVPGPGGAAGLPWPEGYSGWPEGYSGWPEGYSGWPERYSGSPEPRGWAPTGRSIPTPLSVPPVPQRAAAAPVPGARSLHRETETAPASLAHTRGRVPVDGEPVGLAGGPIATPGDAPGRGPVPAGEETGLPLLLPAVHWMERPPRQAAHRGVTGSAWQPLLGLAAGRDTGTGPAPQGQATVGAQVPGRPAVGRPGAQRPLIEPAVPGNDRKPEGVGHSAGGASGLPARVGPWQPLAAPAVEAVPAVPGQETEPALPAVVPEAAWQLAGTGRRAAPLPAGPASEENRPGVAPDGAAASPAGDLPWVRLEPSPFATPTPAGPARPAPVDAEPGPYAAPPAHGLAVMAGAVRDIERVVERRIEVVVTRQRERIEAGVDEKLATERRQVAEEMVSDDVARTLMQKIRSITREEQFRLGRVR